MTLTSHGHHIPYTSKVTEPSDYMITNCAGVYKCEKCHQEMLDQWKGKLILDEVEASIHERRSSFEDVSGYSDDNDRYLNYAKQYVIGAYAAEFAFDDNIEEKYLKPEELYIVWFVKALRNWKALISTSIEGDGLYFEVTHDGSKLETYVDIYKKQANHVFSGRHF